MYFGINSLYLQTKLGRVANLTTKCVFRNRKSIEDRSCFFCPFFIPYPPQPHIPGIPSKFRVPPYRPNSSMGRQGNWLCRSDSFGHYQNIRRLYQLLLRNNTLYAHRIIAGAIEKNNTRFEHGTPNPSVIEKKVA